MYITQNDRGDRQFALKIRVVGIVDKQSGENLLGILGRRERVRRVTDCQQRHRSFREGNGLAAPQVGRHLPGFRELLLQAAGAVENVLDQARGNPDRVAKPLRQIKHKTVRSFGRGGKRIFGALALLIRHLSLRNCYFALPKGEAGKDERNQQSGRKASCQNIAPLGRAAAAVGDEGLRLSRRLRRAARARCNPAFGLLQHQRTQQQAVWPAGH